MGFYSGHYNCKIEAIQGQPLPLATLHTGRCSGKDIGVELERSQALVCLWLVANYQMWRRVGKTLRSFF